MILATLCYLRDDRHTLMLHRNKRPEDFHAGKWNGLGGKFCYVNKQLVDYHLTLY